MSSSDHTWHVIYPAYINSNRSRFRGRRLSKDKCSPEPKCTEIKDILETNKAFRVDLQPNKCYPREMDKEMPSARGRVLYQLVDATDGQFPNKDAVLTYVGLMIPKLKSRIAAQTKTGPEGGQSAQSGHSGGGGGGKKKGKGKR